MSSMHENMLDDVAVYALGALPSSEARRVRDHIASCSTCAAEYAALAPAAAMVGISAEALVHHSGAIPIAPALLKSRIMQQVRREGVQPAAAPVRAKASRAYVWPAYLVAAACFAFAIFSSLQNLSLIQQLKASQGQVAAVEHRSIGLARDLVEERAELADLASEKAQRFDVAQGQIVRVNHRIYLTLHGMDAPPHGKVYQAWTLPKGSKVMSPSSTFVPDSHGAAVVALPGNADVATAVAVSVEPEGGSKAPTSKPVIVQALN